MVELNKVYQGDCLDVMKEIPDKSIDLVLTDIPYGKVNQKSNGLRILDRGNADYVAFDLNELLRALDRICKGSIYIFCGTEQVSEIRVFLKNNDFQTRHLIWEKSNPSPMNGEYIFLSGIENIIFGKRSGSTFNGKCIKPVFKYPCGSSNIHPTQKPIDLFAKLISISSKESDTVLDPFLGSGTTAIACINLNRNFIGIEKEPQYVEIANKRIKEAKQQLKIFGG